MSSTIALSDVTVGIPTCDDDPAVLDDALRAIGAEGLPHPVIIVDMSRGEEVAQVAAARRERVSYIRFPESRGVVDSRNRIAQEASSEIVLFLDADAVPQPGWAAGVARAFAEDPRLAMVGARILPAWPRRPPPLFTTAVAQELLGMLDLGERPMRLPRVMGTSYALHRARLPPGRAEAPFAESLGRRPGRLLSGEEVQLSLEVLADGGAISYEPTAVVRHHIRPERLSWRWMIRRLYSQGLEVELWPQRLEPFPRPLRFGDRVLQLLGTPPFLAGRGRARLLRRRGRFWSAPELQGERQR